MVENKKRGCKYCECEKMFNSKIRIKIHQKFCSKKPQRNPMSLMEHIRNESAGISLFVRHASFRKTMAENMNEIFSSRCEIEGCENQATGWGGTREDGSLRYICHQENCKIWCDDCGMNWLWWFEYDFKDLCDKCKKIYFEQERISQKENREYEIEQLNEWKKMNFGQKIKKTYEKIKEKFLL